ncbi:hypothetical protein ACJMK2_019074 [Sinanodonta woodiana]|uniref:Uncharacterized protein n=1 Tax=Sinanodonta woodiana TaxID=1069815 RepID=A0ABD3UIQ6_SINWO
MCSQMIRKSRKDEKAHTGQLHQSVTIGNVRDDKKTLVEFMIKPRNEKRMTYHLIIWLRTGNTLFYNKLMIRDQYKSQLTAGRKIHLRSAPYGQARDIDLTEECLRTRNNTLLLVTTSKSKMKQKPINKYKCGPGPHIQCGKTHFSLEHEAVVLKNLN